MKLLAWIVASGLAGGTAAGCATATAGAAEISPAIYLMDGYVELPLVRTLDECAEAVRAGVKSPDPKALGQFRSNPQAGPNAFLGGCLSTKDYYWVSPTEVVPAQLQ